jgi:hypothetical protein
VKNGQSAVTITGKVCWSHSQTITYGRT